MSYTDRATILFGNVNATATPPDGVSCCQQDRVGKNAQAASRNLQGTWKHLQQERMSMESQQDSPSNPIKDRLIAKLQTARAELKRAKTLFSAGAQAQDQPDGGSALTITRAEYECAVNQYHTAVNGFADFVLSQAGSER
jgi:hypothetical protein